MTVPYFDDLNIGDEIPALTKRALDETQFVKYAGNCFS